MKDLYSRLLSQEVEASQALIGLILLITLNSIAFAYMIFESYDKKIVSSILVYAILSLFLYGIHPGRNFVTLTSYLTFVTASMLVITAIIILVPRLARGKIEEGSSLLSVVESLFSMGKRNLLRRKLRFVLTFFSVFILSLSFVALTSASFEYGLIFNSQNWAISTTPGLMIKNIPYNPASPVLKGHFNELSEETLDWVNGVEVVVTASRKAESLPSLDSYGYVGDQPIYGILGLDTSTEPTLKDIESSLIEGRLPEKGLNEVAISDLALLSSTKTIGDTIFFEGFSLEIVGVFNKEIMHVRDINGELIVPNTHINVNQDMSAPLISVVPCEYESVIITDIDVSLEIDEDIRLSRISLTVKDDVDKITLSKSLALERGLRVWASTGTEVFLAKIGDQFVGKGTLLIVPYVIVILNVVATILQSFYERRREVNILSSVGLSPSHIAGILVAEASIIGILGGAFGHLAGLSIYPVLSLFTSAPLARQKISAIWSLGTIGIALAAASISALFSLKWSVNITPSLTRKWSVDESPGYYTEPWVIPIPAKVSEDDFQEFAVFITNQLLSYRDRQSFPNITSFRGDLTELENGKSTLSFWYREGETGVGGASVKCSLVTTKFDSNYKLELICFGSQVEIYKAGNFIRHIIMRWNVQQ
jgi:ABC-type antimicrobial peptide transport system permease subunit